MSAVHALLGTGPRFVAIAEDDTPLLRGWDRLLPPAPAEAPPPPKRAWEKTDPTKRRRTREEVAQMVSEAHRLRATPEYQGYGWLKKLARHFGVCPPYLSTVMQR